VSDILGHALLSVDGFTVARGGRLVVEDVSFVAAPGDLIAVVGPNGAGKSSLFAALLGLIPPAAGRFVLTGSFAYVPQHGSAAGSFPATALDVALQGAYRRSSPFRPLGRVVRRHAEEALDRVQMRARAREPFAELSGGQQQRVLLARALVQEGSVLLLDEPLSGVDAVSEEAIMRALGEERAEGRAVLMATHDLALARTRCTQALLLDRRVYGFGPPAEALSAANLRAAYGERIIVLDELGQLEAIDEGSHHHHRHGDG
jgi:ABC-type Mn2+/Zn2+ transport system ATPase subunit